MRSYLAVPLIAIGMWWIANTVAHHFIHRRFFSRAAANAGAGLLLTGAMGIPQTVWRDRHLAHHGGDAWRFRVTPQIAGEIGLLLGLWGSLIVADSGFFLTVYGPGWVLGLALCAVQGHYEHARGVTSHYGRVYNAICFNDGYHAEHHAFPGLPWTELPARASSGSRSSRWPPLLRWLDDVTLDGLERLVLRSPRLQRFVIRRHRRAFEELLPCLPPVRRVAIVGGGLFPRTALVLRELLPSARITIVDADADNIATARAWLPPDVRVEHRRFPADGEFSDAPPRYDLLVIPLAFDGDRQAIYRTRSTASVAVHDWLWHRRGLSRIVSPLLLKRVNLIVGPEQADAVPRGGPLRAAE
jgi:hypothetical protein